MLKWIISFILKLIGVQIIPKEQKDLEKKATSAVERVREEQEEIKARKDKEWEDATNEEKQKKLLDRFTNNDSGD